MFGGVSGVFLNAYFLILGFMLVFFLMNIEEQRHMHACLQGLGTFFSK